MTTRTDQEMIDYFSSDQHVLNQIAIAIRANDDFKAVKLILIFENRADASNASFAAWTLGPVKGQAVISDFIEAHSIDLEPRTGTAAPKAQPIRHKARRVANGLYLYRMFTIRKRKPFIDTRGIWDITEDGESKPCDTATSLRDAKAMIDQRKANQ